jgi:hypothetical protein
MKQIIELFMKRFRKDIPTPLGRWNIDYCSKKINNKIDLSNEDHCGTCGEYIITKTTKPTKQNLEDKIKNKSTFSNRMTDVK